MIKNEMFAKYLRDISALSEKLDEFLDNASGSDERTMEEDEIHTALWKAAEALRDAKHDIKHFSKPAKEGRLQDAGYGKFEILYKNKEVSYPLSCGVSLEVYLVEDFVNDIEAGWYAGRVEHRDGGYYFYGKGKPFLHVGMKVRKRQ
jgi:hypothetical protein